MARLTLHMMPGIGEKNDLGLYYDNAKVLLYFQQCSQPLRRVLNVCFFCRSVWSHEVSVHLGADITQPGCDGIHWLCLLFDNAAVRVPLLHQETVSLANIYALITISEELHTCLKHLIFKPQSCVHSKRQQTGDIGRDIIILSYNCMCPFRPVSSDTILPPLNEDDDVANERRRVLRGSGKRDLLRIQNLTKVSPILQIAFYNGCWKSLTGCIFWSLILLEQSISNWQSHGLSH